MPDRKIILTPKSAHTVYGRLSQISGSKAQKKHCVNLMQRILKAWPEMDPESDLVGSKLDPKEKRDVLFTPEEQRAVAAGLTDLCNGLALPGVDAQGNPSAIPVTVAVVASILNEAKIFGSGIFRYVDEHTNEKLEPFDGEWDEDAALLNTPE